AFFCLLFFAAAKKSRCRPAQGQRLKRANESRMPAKTKPNQTKPNQTKPKTARAAKAPTQHPPHRPHSVADEKKPKTKPQQDTRR
ncbi:hypothetical protein, partial [Paraburkholderia caribensis]|uniref:hypothetical protein n=1 Tax=Paraburkholderia caribensis TaxID=75105 RepID=UPI002091AC32